MSLPVPSPEALRPLLQRAAAEYSTLKQRAEANVARWVWATGDVRSLKPGFDAKIHGMPEGKELAAPPAKRARHYEYGLDADGRPAVVRLHSDQDGHFTEDFFFHHPDRIEQWSYGPHPQFKDPRGVGLLRVEGGRVVDYANLNADGRTQAEAYGYEDGRLITLHRVGEKPSFDNTFHHTYDAAGRLMSITMEAATTGKRGVVYQRPARPAAALLKEVRERLRELIPAKVAALSPPGPAFALALIYEAGSPLSILPPKLAVGLEEERQRWRASGQPRESLWDGQSFASFDDDRLELDDPALLTDTRELAAHLGSEEGLAKARKVLVDLAKDLNKADLGIPVTPDFVVYPVDLHTEHLVEDLSAALPAAKLKALKARGEI